MKKVQFFTRINTKNGFRGAQVKTWDYFHFVNAHHQFKARMKFHPLSVWNEQVKWEKNDVLNGGIAFESPDLFVLKGGQDWIQYKKLYGDITKPIISPIVNYRVLDESHPSNQLLSLFAHRVCPNQDLANRLSKNPKVKGPVYCIPHGVDAPSTLKPLVERQTDLLIVAIKNKSMGQQIHQHFKSSDISVALIDQPVPHTEFMDRMANSKIALHLPQKVESFYLPGLESLRLGTITIMPDCKGNVDYSKKSSGAFLCPYEQDELVAITQNVLNTSMVSQTILSEQAFIESKSYSLAAEQKQWFDLLDELL